MQLIDTYNNSYQLNKEIKMTNDFTKLLLKKNKILIFGRYGQLGVTFHYHLIKNPNVLQLSSKEVNFLNPNQIRRVINDFKPKYIINTAAYTDVDAAESNTKIANQINCDAVKVLAESSKINNSTLIHFSTDYVFDGKNNKKYKSSDVPNPSNEYGRSKFEGEKAIIESGCEFFIFRISWLVSEFGNNFIKSILHKMKSSTSIPVVNDQIGSPISSNLVCQIVIKILSKNIKTKKIFHLSTKGEVSWYDVAIYVSQIVNSYKNVEIVPIKSSEYPAKACRPKNSLFDLSETEKITGISLPFWKDEIKPIIERINLNC